ncbi:MAG: stress response translation initiation inhibitor YciH [Candidatus Diapherotrites archaeon]|nr:stress response translation initiation inhibitor YciH [Candidatus Diapherotrites archaeon]
MCSICGLPQDLCTCEQLAKEKQKVRIRTVQRKFRKKMTIVSGFDKDINIKDLGKDLKKKLATGGTVKNDTIELQGDQKNKAKAFLLTQGFTEEQIDVL